VPDITKYPTGNGDIVGGTPGYVGDTTFYLCVDEVSPDDVSTYIYWGTTDGNILYTISSPGVPTGATVNYVRVYYRGRDAGGTAQVVAKAGIKVGGTQYNVDSGHLLTATWTTWYYDYTVNPKTGVAWTVSDVNTPGNTNGLQQIGAYGNYYFDGKSYYYTNVTQTYVVIHYTANLPTVTTQAVTAIGATTATANGTLVDTGGSDPWYAGCCWATHTNPTTADDYGEYYTEPEPGAYEVAMANLDPGTHYYVRAWGSDGATNSYGSQVEFDTVSSGAVFMPDGPGEASGAGAWGFIS
jgi:hypothetical protein